MNLIAALMYIRVSSTEQAKGWSPDTQRAACYAYAEQHGMTVVDVFEDVETGSIVERAGFQQMMQAIRQGKATCVIVFQTDRLHRDLAHAMLTRKELQKLGVELHTVKRGKSGATPEEQFADNIDDLLAELERARIIERTNRGKKAKMQSGQVLGAGSAPYGYQYIGQKADRRLIVDEQTAPIVRQIFTWYAFGDGEHGPLGVNAIADRLTAMAVPSPADVAGRTTWHKIRPANTWTRSHVYPLLNQTAYSGTYTLYKRKRIDKTHYTAHKPADQFHIEVPPIVEAATWEAAQRRLELGKALSPGHQTHDYLLGRHIRCACGYKAHGRVSSKNGRHKEQRLWYVCNGRVGRLTANRCPLNTPWYRAEVVDMAVWDALRTVIANPSILEDRIAQRQKRQQQTKPATNRDSLIRQRTKIERANQRMLDLYEAEEIDRQEWRRRKAANDTQIAEINAQLAALDAPAPEESPPMSEPIAEAVRALAAEARPRLDHLPFDGRRKLIDAFDVQATLLVIENVKHVRIESIFGVDVLPIP
jgi:site-specific DNA recombinase